MSKYRGDKPKIYEIAKEMGMKSPELLDLLAPTELDYTGFSSTVHHSIGEIEAAIKASDTKQAEDELEYQRERGVNLVGMYYNPETRKYHVADVKLPIKQFEALGGNLDRGHGTVYIAKPKLGARMEKNGILYPNRYSKEKSNA